MSTSEQVITCEVKDKQNSNGVTVSFVRMVSILCHQEGVMGGVI